jgi:serine/threonine protein kinase
MSTTIFPPRNSRLGPAKLWLVGDRILDRYDVRAVFEGGMGRVYRVFDIDSGDELAIKTPLYDRLGTDLESCVRQFVRETETWVKLGDHPNIVHCHKVGTVDGLPLAFAEWVDGGSLRDWIDDERLYGGTAEEALARAIDIAIQVAWGLEHLHRHDLVHQDVKPQNVLLTSQGVAKVTDFGVAKVGARFTLGEVFVSHDTVFASYIGGTPGYSSPEHLEGGKLSRRSDVWGYGLSLLHMFRGECTPAGRDAPEVLEECRQHSQRLRLLMPQAVMDLLTRCFLPEPYDRPRIEEVAGKLRVVYRHLLGRPYPREEPTSRYNRPAHECIVCGRELDWLFWWCCMVHGTFCYDCSRNHKKAHGHGKDGCRIEVVNCMH